jgi:hypothetical protein
MSKVRNIGSRSLGLLVTGVCLMLLLLVTLGAAPALASEPGSGSGSLPSGITPVVILTGSDYDMGYQYAQQVIALYGPWFFQRVPSAHEPFSDDQMAALKAYENYAKQYYPEWIGRLQGVAAGATAAGVPMTYYDALAWQFGVSPLSGGGPSGSGNDTQSRLCSVWSAWGKTTKDGRLIAADSGDGNVTFDVAILAFPDTGHSYFHPVGGGGSGMNSAGVFFGSSAGEATRFDKDYASGYDQPNWQAMDEHLLRFSDNAKQALAYQMSLPMSGGDNRMFADVTGNAYVLEQSAAFKTVRKPGDFGEGDFLHMRNTFLTAKGGVANLGGKPGKFYPHGGWALNPPAGVGDPGGFADVQMASVRTNQTMYNMFREYQGKVDLNFAEMLWRFTGVMPKDPFSTTEYRATKALAWETPGNLGNGSVNLYTPDNGSNGVAYMCYGPLQRIGSPYEPGPDDDYYEIGNTHTFWAVALADNPADSVQSARYTARFDLAKAYQQLMWLNYRDVGYEGLQALFDTATSEYYSGANWKSRADLATGNDKIMYLAEALTAYTRCQCHAQQVYEALFKPATTPSDLGLKPYIAYHYGF